MPFVMTAAKRGRASSRTAFKPVVLDSIAPVTEVEDDADLLRREGLRDAHAICHALGEAAEMRVEDDAHTQRSGNFQNLPDDIGGFYVERRVGRFPAGEVQRQHCVSPAQAFERLREVGGDGVLGRDVDRPIHHEHAQFVAFC